MGQRLLLVDSDRSFLKEHQVSLEAAFDLEVMATPEGVVPRLESGAFAAVFICVEVADNKGYALCSTIRKNPALEGVKLVLISAKATEEEYRRHQSLKGRADLYLHKPIAPSALVAALTPLVPLRALDPDNPLGELVDTELGDDWLDGLKTSLDQPATHAIPAPVFGVRPSSPVQTTNLGARVEAAHDVSSDSRHMKLLEDQVATLHEELRAKDQRLAEAERRILAAEAEAQQIQRQMNSVTLNLDELERSNRESEALKTRLAETEVALRSLEELRGREGESAEMFKAQLKEAFTERTDLIQQVEALNHQVGEKTHRAIELLKERDRLLHENMDLEPYRGKAHDLEAALAGKDGTLAAKEEALAAKHQELEAVRQAHIELSTAHEGLLEQHANLQGVHRSALQEGTAKEEALAAKHQELEAIRQAHAELNATHEGLQDQHANLEGVHQAALLEVAGYKDRVHTHQLELAGLEATMRGQGRDLAELGAQLRQREEELAAAQAQHLAKDQELAGRQEVIQRQQEELTHLAGQLAGVRQELDETKVMHEGERLELMNGLDHKEAEIGRLNQALIEQQHAHGALEREKQAVHGQLSEHRDRLQNLDGLLQEIQDKLRRGSDLAKG